jgi:hypothetical protein
LVSPYCSDIPLTWSRIILAILGRECFGPSKWWFRSFTRSRMNILGNPLIWKRRNFSNLFDSIQLL